MSATIKKSEKVLIERNEQICYLITKAMEKQRLTVGQLANKMKVGYGSVYQYVIGGKLISMRIIPKFESALNITLIHIPKVVKTNKK